MGWASTLEDIVDRFNESQVGQSSGCRPRFKQRPLQVCPLCRARVGRLNRHLHRVHGSPCKHHAHSEIIRGSTDRLLVSCDRCGCAVRADRLAAHRWKVHRATNPPPRPAETPVRPTVPISVAPGFAINKAAQGAEQPNSANRQATSAGENGRVANAQHRTLPPRQKCNASVHQTPTLWVYKCNTNDAHASGDWQVFFREGSGEWGGSWCIRNHYSLQLLREEIKVGHLVLAWQTDRRAAVGLCRVSELPDDGDHIAICLETVRRFRRPIKLLELKKQYPELANGNAFKQGKLGTLFDTTRD